MATVDLQVTSVISSTGWVADSSFPSDLQTSDDSRATNGEAGELINCELDNVPGDFGSMNNVTLHVESRNQGTIGRTQDQDVELLDGADLQLEIFNTGNLTASDVVYNSTAFTRTDNAAAINAWRLRVTAQEGGGMAEDETQEIDHMWVTLDYNVAGGGSTPYYYNMITEAQGGM